MQAVGDVPLKEGGATAEALGVMFSDGRRPSSRPGHSSEAGVGDGTAATRTGPVPDCQSGFTLIELVVVMLLTGLLSSLGFFSFASWQSQSEHRGTSDLVISQLRQASVSAVSEGRTHCVELRPTTAEVQTWRYACGTTPAIFPVMQPQGRGLSLAATVPAATSTTPCPTGSKCFYFYPRGTATPGTVVVASTKRSRTYSIRVEGLTARVFS